MKDGQFYFSKETVENQIWDASQWMTYWFIPNKCWSISAWKVAIDMRKNFYLTGIVNNG